MAPIALSISKDEDENVVSGDIGGCLALNLLVCLPFLFLSLATASSDFLHSVVKMMITPVLMNRLTTIENS